MMLVIIMLITVGILLSFLLIGSALLNKNSGEKQIRYVPSFPARRFPPLRIGPIHGLCALCAQRGS